MARGRSHSRAERGGRGIPESGPALLDRQGFERAAASCAQGLLPGQAAVPLHACRHDVEIPRHDRVSRPHRARARTRSDRPCQPGRASRERRRSDRLRLRGPYPRDEDGSAAPGARAAWLRCGHRRGAARRGEEPGQGAHLLVRAPRPCLGPARRSGRSCGVCSTRASRRASRCGCSRCRTGPKLDVWRLHPGREDSGRAALFRQAAAGGRARGHADPASTTSACRCGRAKRRRRGWCGFARSAAIR